MPTESELRDQGVLPPGASDRDIHIQMTTVAHDRVGYGTLDILVRVIDGPLPIIVTVSGRPVGLKMGEIGLTKAGALHLAAALTVLGVTDE